MRGSFAVLVTGFVFLAACNTLLGTCDLEARLEPTGGAGGAGGGAAGGDGGGGAIGTGADGGGGSAQSACESVCGTPGCGTCPPMEMVTIPGALTFQIDAKEVTNEQYEAFLATNPSLHLAPEDECWVDNLSFVQGDYAKTAGNIDVAALENDYMVWINSDETGDDRPAAFVDWCDANAYCTWAGKQLCGDFDGETYRYDPEPPAVDVATSRWFAACVGSPAKTWPYGDTFNLSFCNYENSGPGDVGEWPSCEGGYPGLYDMSGNVAEWENACTQYGNPEAWNQNCLIRGGNWYLDETRKILGADTRCDALRPVSRFNMGRHIGFRCCSTIE